MPRTARVAPGEMIFHVLNRGVGRRQIFDKDGDYAAFEGILAETLEKCPMRMWPEGDDDLGVFMQRLSVTHVTRWQ